MLFVGLTQVSLCPRFTGWTGATNFVLGATRFATYLPISSRTAGLCSFRVFLSALPVRWGPAGTTLLGGQGCDLTSAWVELGEPTSGSSSVFLNSFSGRRGWAPWSTWWGRGAKTQLLCWMWADQAAGLGDLFIWRPELSRLAPHPSSLARLCQPLGLQQSKLLVGFPVCALQAGALSSRTPVLLAGSPSSLSLSQSDSQWLSPQMLCDSHGAKPEQEFPEVTPSAGGAGCQPCALLCPWSCRQGATLGKGPSISACLFLLPFLAVCHDLCAAGGASASFLCSEIRSAMSYSCIVVSCSLWEGESSREWSVPPSWWHHSFFLI